MTPPDHLMAGLTVGAVYSSICGMLSVKRFSVPIVFILCALSAILPDADALRGVYSSTDLFTGHRGITHSIFFVLSVSLAFTILYAAISRVSNYYRSEMPYRGVGFLTLDLFTLFSLSGLSHLVMDLPQPPGVWRGIPLLFPLTDSGNYVRSGGWGNIGWYDYRITYIFFISIIITFALLTISLFIKRISPLKKTVSAFILINCIFTVFLIADHIRHSEFKGSREWNNQQRLYLEDFNPAIINVVSSGRLIILGFIK